MKLSHHFTKVTPLSKSLAFLFFLLFPLVGFYAGMLYQKTLDAYFYTYPSSMQSLATPTPLPQREIRVQMVDLGKTVSAKVGDTITFSLATPFTWGFSFQPHSLIESTGIANEYKAIEPGTVLVTASGRPVCRPGQLCSQLVLYFNTAIRISGN